MMKSIPFTCLIMLLVIPACLSTKKSASADYDSLLLFNGKDLTGWVNINNAPNAWLIENGAIYNPGNTSSNLRTSEPYDNFELEFDYFILQEKTDLSLVIHAAALPGIGQSLPNGLATSLNIPARTIAGAWNHVKVSCKNGSCRILLNGNNILQKIIKKDLSGYICFAAGYGKFKLRDIRLKQLSVHGQQELSKSDEYAGFCPLYNNTDLSGWKMLPGHLGHWTTQDWKINYDGKSTEMEKSLWTEKSFRNFILIADFRLTRKPELAKSNVVLASGENALNPDGTNKEVDILYAGDTGIYLRGNDKSQVNIGYRYIGSGEIYGYRTDKTLPPEIRAGATPKVKADRPPGEWNRLIITMRGEFVSVSLNGILVIDQARLPGIPATGPIALQDDHADNNCFQFANLFIKELD